MVFNGGEDDLEFAVIRDAQVELRKRAGVGGVTGVRGRSGAVVDQWEEVPRRGVVACRSCYRRGCCRSTIYLTRCGINVPLSCVVGVSVEVGDGLRGVDSDVEAGGAPILLSMCGGSSIGGET
jgi:hypothetical protein